MLGHHLRRPGNLLAARAVQVDMETSQTQQTLDIDPEHTRLLAGDLRTAATTITPTPAAPVLPGAPLARFSTALAGALSAVATRTGDIHARAGDLATVSFDLVAAAEDTDGRLAHGLGRLA